MSFATAIERVLSEEGGYVNDIRDAGGETKYGISKRAYPSVDIASLTLDDAKAIYKRDYWDACRCDELPDRIAAALFDSAVNSGRGPAVKWLQQALNVTADGVIGTMTAAAITALHFGQVTRSGAFVAFRFPLRAPHSVTTLSNVSA